MPDTLGDATILAWEDRNGLILAVVTERLDGPERTVAVLDGVAWHVEVFAQMSLIGHMAVFRCAERITSGRPGNPQTRAGPCTS